MSLAEKYCLTAAFIFLMIGLLSGIWKYWLMIVSENGRSRYYVDIAHRSALMYTFAAIALGQFAKYSVLDDWVNEAAALSALIFFGLAIGSYLIHGFMDDTNNQIRDSKNGAHGAMPMWTVNLFMVALIIAEVGGSAVLGVGAMLSIWV